MRTLGELESKLMKNPAFRAEYEKLALSIRRWKRS